MHHSARQFVIRRSGDRTEVIAGYPWFGEIGRQTLVALPGITLEQGHKEDCMDALDTIVRGMRDGMFTGTFSMQEAADAPLWFFWTLQRLAEEVSEETVWRRYGEAMKQVLGAYRRGVEGIGLQADGLIRTAMPGRALTWMDTMVDGAPVAPRSGYAVEINALWYNAVCYALRLAERFGDEAFAAEWRELPERTRRSFLDKFWIEDERYLADYVDEQGANRFIRPNMIVACGLDFTMLDEQHRADVVRTVRQHLLTPKGLRSLSPRNPLYESRVEGQFDVIHAHDWLTYYAGIAAKRVSGKPLVVHMHATEYDRSGENVNTQVYAIEKAGMEAADKVIAVSNLTRNIVIQKYGIPADKVVTVHNAVRFPGKGELPPERGVEDKVVTFLGRITYQKGPDYFVEAAAKVLKRVPGVRFVMAGSGDMMNHVIRRVARLGIADRFHFTGFLRGEDVNRMFQLSDVYVMPSVSEPFGISPLEAMRSNVPVIISKQSGVAEVLDYALKVDYWDVDALADAIYGLITYPALARMFAKKGHEEVTGLKWNNAAAKIRQVYEEVVAANERNQE